MNNTATYILALTAVLLSLTSVIKAFVRLLQKRAEEKKLIIRLEKDAALQRVIKRYEGLLNAIDDEISSSSDNDRIKEIIKLRSEILEHVDKEVNSYIKSYKNRFKQTSVVVNSTNRYKYFEKLLDRLIHRDLIHR